ncbi:MAG: BspA family leucine-rich repeat surface protein [Lachnospiraceae bacterium]|nr:BspA family leucine-rich repeat surface protein [Lachnospiraceae bacterium]
MVKKSIALILTTVIAGALMLPPAFAEEIPDPDSFAAEEMSGDPEITETDESGDEENPEEDFLKPVMAKGANISLLQSSGTDNWLEDWDYTIDDLDYDGKYIYLKEYKGTETDISIGGKATVDGVDYPVCIEMESTSTHYKTGLNRNKNLRQITFYSVDGVPVRPELNWRVKDLFYGMENLEGVNFGNEFKTDGVTDAISMFQGCKKLKYVDVENLDLGKCSNLKQMFSGCESLNRITINLNYALNMTEMFQGCKGLTEVTITGSGSNTGKLVYADDLFSGCKSLESVDISGLDFSGVKDFSYMFYCCSSLKDIDMGMFNMSGATNLNDMFLYCSGLKEIDLSTVEWGTATPNANEMFYRADNLERIKVSEAFKPKTASGIFQISDFDGKKLTITGTPSQEFKDAVYPTLKDSNRFVGYVKLRSKIELEGKDLEDGLFGVKLQSDRDIIYGINSSDNDNIIEIRAKVYAPGSNTFTIEEVYEPSGSERYISCLPMESAEGYECEDAVRSKTVDITLNTDGSLSVEE